MGVDSKAEPTSGAGGSSSPAHRGGMPIEKCQNMIRRSLRDPTVRFLMGHLEKSGCGVGSDFVKAVNCNEAIAGGYVPGEGHSVFSGKMARSNHLELQDHVTQVVIHELIHAYDDCRAANLDWSNCAHHACSEIRAAHLSGDCHYKRELLRGYMKLRGHEQDCVKRSVMESLARNPDCSKIASKDAMEAVWDVCYNDTKPFDRAP